MINFHLESESLMVHLFHRYLELSKKTYEYYEGISLYPSEIHTIEYIAINIKTNLTDIARAMGLTKGAISKMMSKLIKMDIVKQYKDINNQKEKYFDLTELGVKVFDGHKKYHEAMDKKIENHFLARPQQEKQAVLDFLKVYLEEMNNLKE